MAPDHIDRPSVTPTLPALHDVEQACRSLQLGIGASELHGALCGWLSGGGDQGEAWLAQVLVDPDAPRAGDNSTLAHLFSASVAQIEDRSFGFALLVPDEDAPLAERSGSVFEWCRGFVGAFGLAAGQHPPLSEEGREALGDLVKLAGGAPQEEGDDEDEAALTEIEEFIRVATLLLHGDCAMGPRHRNQLN